MDSRDAMILTLFYLNEHNIAEISDICSHEYGQRKDYAIAC